VEISVAHETIGLCLTEVICVVLVNERSCSFLPLKQHLRLLKFYVPRFIKRL